MRSSPMLLVDTQVATPSDGDELSMVPVDDVNSMRFSTNNVSTKFIEQTWNEQWRNATQWRQPMLEDVIQDSVVKRQNVFQLGITEAVT
jgi:hypothetical protein